MIRINRNSLLLLLADLTMILTSIVFSFLIKFDFHIPHNSVLMSFPYFLILLSLKIIFFQIFGLYRGMYRYTSIWDLIKLLKANFCSTIVILLISFFFLSLDIYKLLSFFTLDFILCVVLTTSSRLCIRIYFSHLKSFGKTNMNIKVQKNVIIIGGG